MAAAIGVFGIFGANVATGVGVSVGIATGADAPPRAGGCGVIWLALPAEETPPPDSPEPVAHIPIISTTRTRATIAVILIGKRDSPAAEPAPVGCGPGA